MHVSRSVVPLYCFLVLAGVHSDRFHIFCSTLCSCLTFIFLLSYQNSSQCHSILLSDVEVGPISGIQAHNTIGNRYQIYLRESPEFTAIDFIFFAQIHAVVLYPYLYCYTKISANFIESFYHM